MRLTLRTLLAWLDDTLPAAEVKAISRQLDESPYAKELVARISKVTRQRRLLVPPSSGADAVDPNLVASYLDNELDPDRVAEYEKLCLTSSVNLAEAASVHQILSLVGQKAKVPPDVRFRMYRLIKGRETSARTPAPTPAPTPGRKRSAGAKPRPSQPVSQPIPTWGPEPEPGRNWLETYAPAGIVLTLVLVLGITAVYSLSGDGKTPPLVAQAAPNEPKVEDAAQPGAIEKPAPPTEPAAEPAPPVETATGKDAATEPMSEPDTAKPKEAPAPASGAAEFPAGAVGALAAVQGAILVENPESKAWESSKEGAIVKEDAHVLNLAPFRNTLKTRELNLSLIGGGDVVLRRLEANESVRLELKRGRVAFGAVPDGHSVAVKIGQNVVQFSPKAGASAGVERVEATTLFHLAKGEASIRVGTEEKSGEGPVTWTVSADGKLGEGMEANTPAWVGDPTGTPAEIQSSQSFAKYFRDGRPPLASLVEALDDEQNDVRILAIDSISALGDMELVVPVLNRPKDPAARKAAADHLREILAGPADDRAQAVRKALEGELGDPWGPIAEKLILGYNRDDAMNEMVMAKLVSYLKDAPFVGVRELALENLKRLTGRDSLDYDPENPMGKGLKAWEDLLMKKDLSKDVRKPKD